MYTIDSQGNIFKSDENIRIPLWDDNNHLTIEYKEFLNDGGIPSAKPQSDVDLDFLKIQLDNSIQKILDYVAYSFGYSSMDRAVTYVNSTNLDWKEEAEALIAYRDAVWESVMSYISVHGYPTQQLSLEQLQALLPSHPTPWLQKPV